MIKISLEDLNTLTYLNRKLENDKEKDLKDRISTYLNILYKYDITRLNYEDKRRLNGTSYVLKQRGKMNNLNVDTSFLILY
jgi:hypothetical protein